MSEFIDSIRQSERYDAASVIGYSDREISHIATLYRINVTGQLYKYLHQIGRCAGNVIGDDEFVFYTAKTVKEHFAYQFWRREDTRTRKSKTFFIGAHGAEDLILRTDIPDDDTVYTYNREKNTLESTGITLLDRVSECVHRQRFPYQVSHSPVSFNGELIKYY